MEIFNLIDSPWIPVLFGNGEWRRIGLKELFERAKEIRTVAPWNPQDEASLLRFLIAIIYWTRGNFSEEKRRDDFQDVVEKLESHRDCFNLLGEGRRFYQVEMMNYDPRPISYLYTELPSGTNIAHFYHLTDKNARLCLPCCALGLVRWGSYAQAGLDRQRSPSFPAGIHGNNPSYFFPDNNDLAEIFNTLWVPVAWVEGDAPSWVDSRPQPLGIMKALTYQSRAIRLIEERESSRGELSKGDCHLCGDRGVPVIGKMIFTSGWVRPYNGENNYEDPFLMTIRIMEEGQEAERRLVLGVDPNDSSEAHAEKWIEAFKAIAQRAIDFNRANQFWSVMTGRSQSLLKDSYEMIIPAIPAGENLLEEELQWLENQLNQIFNQNEIKTKKLKEPLYPHLQDAFRGIFSHWLRMCYQYGVYPEDHRYGWRNQVGEILREAIISLNYSLHPPPFFINRL